MHYLSKTFGCSPERFDRVRMDRIYLEGQGDLVSRIIIGIIGDTIWLIGVINILTKSP